MREDREDEPTASRRALIRGTLAAGLAVGSAPWRAAAEALAAADADIPRIRKSGLAIGLDDFAAPPRTAGKRPFAALNTLYHAGDGSGRLFTNDTRGVIWRLDPATGAASPFLDLRKAEARTVLKINGPQMGLRSFAFHPDHARPGKKGHLRLYTATTETVASRPRDVKVLPAPPTTITHDAVVAEWRVLASDHDRVDPASRRELFRVPQYLSDHQLDQLLFDPNAAPGSAGYGKLLIGLGDGGNMPGSPDRYDLAQAPGAPHGKILRIDPLPRAGGGPYGVPVDNPFVGRRGWLPEIWALGFRHPQNLSFDPAGAGALVIADIGQGTAEELDLGRAGANYGWPLREGTIPSRKPRRGSGVPPTGPVAQYGHAEGSAALGRAAIVGGYVYRGSRVPALAGQYLFGDLVAGRIFHVPVAELVQGRLAVLEELTLRRDGREATLLELTGSTNGRVDLRFGQDEAGEVYVLTKQDGMVRRIVPAA